MKLIASYKSNGKPQRQLFSVGSQLYRRLTMIGDETLTVPVWQKQIHNGDWHNIMDPKRVAALENDTPLDEVNSTDTQYCV